MSNVTYKRGADLTREMLDDFRQYLTAEGYGFLLKAAQEDVEDFGAVTCIASIHAIDNGDILQKQYFLGGDESCPMFELNACMCGVESL